ncbi:MAG: hypothetical protein IPO07_13875 [Haliscomenobacter sp.]|nr:hypothetical protein [Haliscomenobacter sp.]MBK9489742.1 hypothetical protein [Haliscomenobacter sp.]
MGNYLSYEANAQPSMYTLNGKQYLVINATSNFTRDSYDYSKSLEHYHVARGVCASRLATKQSAFRTFFETINSPIADETLFILLVFSFVVQATAQSLKGSHHTQ